MGIVCVNAGFHACIRVNVPDIAVREVCVDICVELAVRIHITGPLTRDRIVHQFIANVTTPEIDSFKSIVDPAWWQRGTRSDCWPEPQKHFTINRLKGETDEGAE